MWLVRLARPAFDLADATLTVGALGAAGCLGREATPLPESRDQ
jgi:hypothetical protein